MGDATLKAFTDLRLGVDIGGTFTDLVLTDDAGSIATAKTGTTPHNPALAVEQGVTLLAERLGLTTAELLSRCSLVVHGTTVATNALLERRGARTALLTTAGFRDLLEMREGRKITGRYDLLAPPPVPLVPRYLRLSSPERVRYSGAVETPLGQACLAEVLDRLTEEQIESVAICFLHSTANPEHERLAEQALAERFPGLYICLSHQVLPQVGEYDRISTTAVNAYLGPVLSEYLRGLTQSLRRMGYPRNVLVLQSHGGVLPSSEASELAVGAVLSGPAAGVYGAAFYGDLVGYSDLVSLDMGGTSTDISLIEGGMPAKVSQREVGGVRIALPSLAVHTLGAGGGSIAIVGPDGLLRVGPQSAGADPGPACYGQGGKYPTVTDANLHLGYLEPGNFLGGRMPLHPAFAETAINRHLAQPLGEDTVQAAYGVYRLVNVQMAEGIRVVTVREGHDPRWFTLLAGGGAAGLHSVALARELGISRVVVPRLASLLSSLGLLTTDIRHELVQACVGELGAMPASELRHIIERLAKEGRRRLDGGNVLERGVGPKLSVDLLYANQVNTLTVPLDEADLLPDNWPGRLRGSFEIAYRSRYGYHQPDQPVHMRAVRVTAIGRLPRPQLDGCRQEKSLSAAPTGTRAVYLGEWVQAGVYRQEQLSSGERLSGPAVVDGDYTTILLPPGCAATVDPWGGMIIDVS